MIDVAKEMGRLHELAKRSSAQIRKPLWKIFTSPEWLAQAWEEIRRNRGSHTAGMDGITAVDVDLEFIHTLSRQLRERTFEPTPVRRVMVPKGDGKTRPLGIPTMKDRIVQQGLKMLLEPIFEADFHPCSHGFRRGRSTTTALRDVARSYSSTRWVIEGDIKGCFDHISHGKLMEILGRCVADECVLRLIGRFLKAGYLEDWKYHRTFSGTPQGGVLSPLLANIFLHQLDDFVIKELGANRYQSKGESNARRNPEYRKLENKISRFRKQLKEETCERREIISEIENLERQRKSTPYYSKDKKHPGGVWYVRYADDFVILVAGDKKEALAIKERVREKLSGTGLELNEEKTRITRWSKTISFLGYQIHGKRTANGSCIRAVLHIPQEKVRGVKDEIKKLGCYTHIPEADVMTQMSAVFRGWSHYYQFANRCQTVFSDLSSHTWWRYAHLIARKEKSSIKSMIMRAQKAGRLGEIKKGERRRTTFRLFVGEKTLTLDIFPPKRGQIMRACATLGWAVDLKPVAPMNWQSGRSLATRLEAMERAGGVCERCRENPAAQVHHRVPLRGKSFLARVMSDRDQRYTAQALCRACHLEMHEGSFKHRSESHKRSLIKLRIS